MQILINAVFVFLGYVLGSIPFGLLIVRLTTGKDLRQVASGRTGGTNAMRAAGFGAGLLTGTMDVLKGACAVWIAQAAVPQNHWVHVLAALAAILGHNYSIFLPERTRDGRLRLRGGAGGAPALGGALGMWWPSLLIILPIGVLVFFGIGYASVTTLSIALTATLIFILRYRMGLGEWQDIFYGVIAFLFLTWALRPNIRALVEGRERFHGWRPWSRKRSEEPAQAGAARRPARHTRRMTTGKKSPRTKHTRKG